MHYYLGASLPELYVGQKPPFSMKRFRFMCKGVISEREDRDLDLLLDGEVESDSHPFLQQWYDLRTQMRNGLACARSSRRSVHGIDCTREHQGYNAMVQQAVSHAFESSDPKELEQELDRVRWRLLDELAAPEPFGFPRVAAFTVKLRIAERWASLDADKGAEALEHMVVAGVESLPIVTESRE